MKSISVIPAVAAMGVLLSVFLLCSGCYTLTQGFTLLGYLNQGVPLESLRDGEESQFVEQILDIRAFASDALGLKKSTNYTRYVAIDRDYLAAVVSGAAPDSFTRYEWRFPIVGKVPYKGFFNPQDAKREGEKLKKRGFDVWIRQVDAFSTLGWFSDPLYSYMRDYPTYRLADLIIHETLHATVYLKGQSQFNEELAEFVGAEGARLYMEKKFGKASPEYQQMQDSEADSAAFIAFIQELIAELSDVYAQSLSREEKLKQKEYIIQKYKNRFDAEYETRFRSDNYRGFSRLPINNAYLELFRLYYAGGDYLRNMYESSGRDLPKFIAAAKTITSKGDPRKQLEDALQ
ncbi:MAG: aminopeptidase [Spirochaetaceae bacterium]|jgi:predicted aminopeptidase|nr:aminopeptidase [Spirochaetaceae bacterium]